MVCALSGSPIHAQRQRFLHLAIPQLAESACESAAPATKSILDLAKALRLSRNLHLTLRKCCACHAIQTLRNLRAAVPMVPSPRPFRTRSAPASVQASQPRWFAHCPEAQFTHSANVFCILPSPSSQRVLAKVLRLPRNLYLTLRKCCESAAPATKSTLDLAKVLRLPRNSNLAKPSRGRANGPVSETVPNPFRTRLRTGVAAEVVCALSGSPIHAQRQRFLHLAIPQLAESACESAAPATKSILDLAKVLRLSRNLHLTLRKCCACHAIQTLRNLRAAVPMVPSPRPFRTRSAPASVQASQPRWFAHCPEAQFTHSANVFCILPSPSSQRVLAKVLRLPRNLYLTLRKCCESAAPATKSTLDLAKVLRLPRNSNLAKPSRGRANGPVSETVPNPFRTRLRTGVAAEVVCALSGSPIHAQRQRFLHLAIPQLAESACESAAPATKSILDLAKVLRLPRNLHLTLRKCCACHAIQTLRNLRAAVPMGPSPRPFRTRSAPASAQASQPRWFAHCPEAQFTHSANVFCILPSPSSQRVLAKVLRLPRNLYLTLRKCCACHEIYT